MLPNSLNLSPSDVVTLDLAVLYIVILHNLVNKQKKSHNSHKEYSAWPLWHLPFLRPQMTTDIIVEGIMGLEGLEGMRGLRG